MSVIRIPSPVPPFPSIVIPEIRKNVPSGPRLIAHPEFVFVMTVLVIPAPIRLTDLLVMLKVLDHEQFPEGIVTVSPLDAEDTAELTLL